MKQYLRLLLAREAKEVVGKKGTNLWLLTIVLVATFSSIAFSEGSMLYLKDKMADPFTNWVNIKKDDTANETFNRFREKLLLPENAQRFDYRDVLMDQYLGLNIQGPDGGRVEYLSIRFFEHLHTPIVKTILDESNIVEGCEVDTTVFVDNTLGFIITQDALQRLGYQKDNLPAYIHLLSSVKTEHAYDMNLDSLGLKTYAVSKTSKFVPIALPLLAVVRKLPNNVDMVSANFFYEQYHYNDITNPFDVTTHETTYLHRLVYWVSDEVGEDTFSRFVSQKGTDVTVYDESEANIAMKPWKKGKMLQVDVGGEHQPIEVFTAIDEAVSNQWNETKVQRVYQLDTEEHPSPRSDYLSVEFRSLKHIREFEAFAKKYGISLEMELVHSLENFDAVTVMAGILSSAMVVFSIVCIIMFMVNMLQSYFQKVKRNIGTFKAFGMNGTELIQVYVLILVAIVCSSVILALFITWGIQGLLPVIGVEKDGFNYLSLWNTTTYIATFVIFLSTVLTVIFVMVRMLSQTPGDLIYDRN